MARLSLDDAALERLKAYSQQYGTSDLANIIFALCSERDALMLCFNRPSAPAPEPKQINPSTQSSSELDAFSGLLD